MLLATPAQTFDRLERAHAAWTRGGATVRVVNATPQGTTRATYRLDLDGRGGATVRVESPAQGKSDRIDQTYRIDGATLVGVDAVARETTRRTVPTGAPLTARLTAALGGLDDSLGFLLTREGRDRYLKPFRNLGGWRAVPGGLERRTKGSGKASLTRVETDASGRLRGLHVVFPGSRLDWSLAYGPPRPFALPRGLARVDAFTARPRPPKYADAKARNVVEAMLRAGGALQSAIVRIDGAATLWIGGSRVRYENARVGFAYDGRTLTLKTPGAAYQGRTTRGAVIDYAAALLGEVDPLARSVLVRQPPYLALFSPDARVRVVGTMVRGGTQCDVLAIDAATFRASMFVRRSDRLPLSIETEALGRGGAALGRSTRTLAWSSVGVPPPRGIFALRLRPGQTVLPLPKRKM